MGDGRPARPLKWYVVALAAAISVPLLVLSLVLAFRWIESERARVDAVTLESADNALAQLDRYVTGRIAMLQALATSPAFDTDDYRRVDAQARELLDLQGSTIVLRELDGHQLVNTRLPWANVLPSGTVVGADQEVLRTKRPYVSDLYHGTASGGPLIRIVVPVLRDGEVISTLTASLPPAALAELLSSAGIRPPFFGSVADRNGVILAQTRELTNVGKPFGPSARSPGERGRWTWMNPSGHKVAAAYRRSSLSGWLIAVEIDKEVVEAPLYRSLLMVCVAAVSLCLLALVGSLYIGRTLISSLVQVAETAESLTLGEIVVAPQTAVREADRVGGALAEASARLREQAAEVERANQELEARVAKRTQELTSQAELLAVTLDSMEQGLMLVEADGTVAISNRRLRELLDLPEDLLSGKPSFQSVVDHQMRSGDLQHWRDRSHWLDQVGKRADGPIRYERQRPNGMILDVLAVQLPSGGEVRTYTDVSVPRRAESAIRESEERLRLISDHATDMIVRSELDSTRLYVSSGCRALLGYEPSELVGTRPLDGVHPDDAEEYGRLLDRLRRGEVEQAVGQQRYRRRDGSWVWTEIIFQLTRDADRAATGYVASVRDISTRKAAETALRESEERLALALDSGSDGLWDQDIANDVTWYSDRWCTMLGYEPGEVHGPRGTLVELMHPDDRSDAEHRMRAHLAGETPTYECEHRLRTKSGRHAWVLVRGKVVDRDGDGSARRMVGTLIDIDARKNAESRVAYMARHDMLTDLPNRAVFYERLDQRLKEVREQSKSCAVLCLDLDRFKAVNDTWGHAAGDALLSEVARRIKTMLRAEDTVARLGGDEFAILVHAAHEPEAVGRLAHRLIEAVGRTFLFEGNEVRAGLSVGVAFGPRHGHDSETVFKRADLALYRAKAEGRDTFRFFEPAMDEAVEARRRLEADLRLALLRNEFELHYQPSVDLGSGRISGAEALVRWRHPALGLVSPATFIPLAEETGLIVPLGEWVLRTAISDACAWPSHLRVAVNISAVQLRHAGLQQAVLASLASSTLLPSRLELEITESVLVEDSDGVMKNLRAFHDMGIQIALDDFGTGFSSLSYLRRFPFDKIKIDRSFVAGLDDDETAAIVRTIISLGASLSMSVTAEGVETPAQREFLTDERCTEMQGYLFSKPLPAAEIYQLFHQDRRMEAA